ncbi:MAG: DUF1080 domain-containing protein [Pirellulaceae bacterium]
MNRGIRSLQSMVCVALLAMTTWAAHAADNEGDFRSLFNGRDLSGWVPINVAPGTFRVCDGIIVSTGIPTGLMRTEKQYENFIIELEWRHMKPGGNAGLFVWGDGLTAVGSPFARGIEVQILDNGFDAKGKNEWYTTHGDVFPVLGSTMTPTGRISSTRQRSFPIEDRSKSSPDWNHYRLEGRDGVLRLSVNGKEVTVGKDGSPRKGYLCLESEGSECHFRNIRICELPSTNPSADEIADVAEGFVPLYTGADLSHWKADPGHEGHWQPAGWRLVYDGRSEAKDKNLWTEKEYGDFDLICDWRWTRKPTSKPLPVLLANGEQAVDDEGQPKREELPDAGDSGIYLRGNSKSQVNMWCWPIGSGEVYGYRTDPSMPAEVRAGVTPVKKADAPIGKWNRFLITMRGDRLTVNLNGETVIENARLPGVPARGPIALQHHGDPIEFANILVKELD